jgi:hypothetical protein
MRPNPALKFEREGPLRTIGHMWTQELLGNWRRHVIRRHEYSRELHFSELTFVDQQRLYCLRCLSQDVVETKALFPGGTPAVKVSWQCRAFDCGMRWEEVPEPLTLGG